MKISTIWYLLKKIYENWITFNELNTKKNLKHSYLKRYSQQKNQLYQLYQKLVLL